jgi:hypothetical protein
VKDKVTCDEILMSAAVLNAAVEQVQQLALDYSNLPEAVAPEDWLRMLKAGLKGAAERAEDLKAENFDPDEIVRQRRAIRRRLAQEDLEADFEEEEDDG